VSSPNKVVAPSHRPVRRRLYQSHAGMQSQSRAHPSHHMNPNCATPYSPVPGAHHLLHSCSVCVFLFVPGYHLSHRARLARTRGLADKSCRPARFSRPPHPCTPILVPRLSCARPLFDPPPRLVPWVCTYIRRAPCHSSTPCRPVSASSPQAPPHLGKALRAVEPTIHSPKCRRAIAPSSVQSEPPPNHSTASLSPKRCHNRRTCRHWHLSAREGDHPRGA
jgi:hypothetical protein